MSSISLRSYGYAVKLDISKRQEALNKAIDANGYELVLLRLKEVHQLNHKARPVFEQDMSYVTSKLNSKSKQISLRFFGYSSKDKVGTRHKAIKKAIQAISYDTVLARLKKVFCLNRSNARLIFKEDINYLEKSTIKEISLRSYGYSTKENDYNRYVSLDKAVTVHGYELVNKRLENVLEYNKYKSIAKIFQNDIEYIEFKYN